MKKLFSLTICLLVFLEIACGQKKQSLETMPEVKSPTSSEQAYPALKIQSDEFVKANMNNDVVKIVEFSHPKIVNEFGGKQEMTDYLKKYPANSTNKDSFDIESIVVMQIKQVVEAGNELFAVIPIRYNVKSPTGKQFIITSMVGISADNGANWKFLLGVDQKEFNSSFPKAAGKIQIPPDQEPKPIESK